MHAATPCINLRYYVNNVDQRCQTCWDGQEVCMLLRRLKILVYYHAVHSTSCLLSSGRAYHWEAHQCDPICYCGFIYSIPLRLNRKQGGFLPGDWKSEIRVFGEGMVEQEDSIRRDLDLNPVSDGY